MRPTWLILLFTLLLLGCQAAERSPLDSGPSTFDGFRQQPTRGAQVLITGSVKLNGNAGGTDDVSPYPVKFNVKSGDILLLKLQATGGVARSVLVTLKGASLTYINQTLTTGGAEQQFPIMILATEAVTLTLYNSETSGGSVYPDAVTWTGSIRTEPKEDLAEVNDDENPATTTDSGLAKTLTVDGPAVPFSFYLRTAGTAQDEEDWHAIPMVLGQTYGFDLTTENGTWGVWNFTQKLYDPTGALVLTRPVVNGVADSYNYTPTLEGTYTLQVVGVPVSRKFTSVFYMPYTLKVRTFVLAQIVAVTPSDVTAGTVGSQVSFTALVAGPSPSLSWNFQGNATPSVTTGNPASVYLLTPGLCNAVVTPSNPQGTGDPFPFSFYATASSTPGSPASVATIPFGSNTANVHAALLSDGHAGVAATAGGSANVYFWTQARGVHLVGQPARQLSMALVDGYPILAYLNSTYNCMNISRATKRVPLASSDWVTYTLDTVGAGQWPSIIDLNGRPAITYYGIDSSLRYARSAVAQPLKADWTLYSIDNFSFTGQHSALVAHQGIPMVVYLENAGGPTDPYAVKFASATSPEPPSGTSWNRYVVVPPGIGRPELYDDWNDLSLLSTGDRLIWSGYAMGNSNGIRIGTSRVASPLSAADWRIFTLNASSSEPFFNGDHCLSMVNGRPALIAHSASTTRIFRGLKTSALLQGDWISWQKNATGTWTLAQDSGLFTDPTGLMGIVQPVDATAQYDQAYF